MCTGGGQRAVFGGWGRVSFIFPFLSLPPISRWASWGRMLSYLMCISGVNLRLSSLQTLCFSPTESFHQHHCWAGDSATYLLDSADRVENPMYRLSWSGRLCGLALCMHQKSTQAMVSDSSSFFALHSNFSFSGGIENLSLVMYHMLAAVTVVQQIQEAYSSCVMELCTPLLTTNFPLHSLLPASVIRILLFYCFLKFHMEVGVCATWSSRAGWCLLPVLVCPGYGKS